MKNAYLRALMVSVMVGFAPLALASAQTDISVSDHNWIKGQQDALANHLYGGKRHVPGYLLCEPRYSA